MSDSEDPRPSKHAPASRKRGLAKLRVRRKGDALPIPAGFETITVESHRELLAMARKLAPRIEQNPEFSVMLLSNPVLALQYYGIELSKDMQRHVLETLRHPPKLRERRKALEASLAEELGEQARPNDEQWMAKLVFERRQLTPLATDGATPAYRSALDPRTIERLQRLRPKAAKRYQGVRRGKVQASVGVAPWQPGVRLLDLAAEPPELPAANAPPQRLTLEQAWFYKRDPVIRDAVELGQIERRAFPFRTPAQFRDLVAGKQLDAFGKYVRSVRILREQP
jgi:hypothetical protein